jgi:hypothetical protein
VLQRLEGQRCVLVSRKASLVTAARAGALPSSIEQVGEPRGMQELEEGCLAACSREVCSGMSLCEPWYKFSGLVFHGHQDNS